MSFRLALVVAGALGALPFVQKQVDSQLGAFRVQEEALYLWSPVHVKRMAAGFEGVAADIYWLRTVQYYGNERLVTGNRDFALLEPLINITTTLDPRLEIAYRYGAIFLCESPPEGAGRCEAGLDLLERGAQAMPQDWRLLQDKGFFTFLFLRDSERAAAEMRRAAKRPGAPFWLEMLAADTLLKGGKARASRAMWQAIRDGSEPGIMRNNAVQRLRMLDSQDRASAIGEAVARYRIDRGRLPKTLQELRFAGYWRGPLVDVADTAFSYDAQSGRVVISRGSPLWRPDLAEGVKP